MGQLAPPDNGEWLSTKRRRSKAGLKVRRDGGDASDEAERLAGEAGWLLAVGQAWKPRHHTGSPEHKSWRTGKPQCEACSWSRRSEERASRAIRRRPRHDSVMIVTATVTFSK